MLCVPVTVGNHFQVLSIFLWNINCHKTDQNNVLNMVSIVRSINHNVGALKTELLDVNINTGVQSINVRMSAW